MFLDIKAPIIPFKGMGGIKLYSTMTELSYLLLLGREMTKPSDGNWITYHLLNSVELLFHRKNSKLFLMRTLDGYEGKLFGKIGVGTKEEEFLKIEPSFIYDDFEEVWESSKGVYIETDPVTHGARWISVFIPETTLPDFEDGNW